MGNQTGVKGDRNDIPGTKAQLAPRIGHGHFIGHVLPRQIRNGLRGGHFHGLIDGFGMHIQRPAENVRKAQNVVHLIGVIGPPRGHNGIAADFGHLFGGNFGIGVGHGKNNGIFRHAGNHIPVHGTFRGQTDKHIGALQGLRQRPQGGVHGVTLFPWVHVFAAAFVNHPFGVTQNAVFAGQAHVLNQFNTGNGRRPRPVDHNFGVLKGPIGQMQGIDHPRQRDDGRAVLVIVEYGDIQQLFEFVFNDKTFRGLDILKVDAPKGVAEIPDAVDEGFGVFGVHLNINPVDVSEAFEQNGFALHHGL